MTRPAKRGCAPGSQGDHKGASCCCRTFSRHMKSQTAKTCCSMKQHRAGRWSKWMTCGAAAIAAAEAGLGPFFVTKLKQQLLDHPEDFIEDQIPLLRDAAKAHLALLDAGGGVHDDGSTPSALKRLVEEQLGGMIQAQQEMELRVYEKLEQLQARVEKGEEAADKGEEQAAAEVAKEKKAS